MLKQRVALLILLASVACLTQGCEYMLATATSSSSDAHSAYADYLFQESQKRAQHAEGEQEPILALDRWCKEIYYPRLEYSDYCQKQAKDGIITGPLLPFDVWKQTEYRKILKERDKFMSPAKRDH